MVGFASHMCCAIITNIAVVLVVIIKAIIKAPGFELFEARIMKDAEALNGIDY